MDKLGNSKLIAKWLLRWVDHPPTFSLFYWESVNSPMLSHMYALPSGVRTQKNYHSQAAKASQYTIHRASWNVLVGTQCYADCGPLKSYLLLQLSVSQPHTIDISRQISPVVRAIRCIVGRLVSPLVSTQSMNSSTTSQLWQTKLSPDTAKCSLGDKIIPSWKPLL